MGGSVPANVPQDSSRAQSTHFYWIYPYGMSPEEEGGRYWRGTAVVLTGFAVILWDSICTAEWYLGSYLSSVRPSLEWVSGPRRWLSRWRAYCRNTRTHFRTPAAKGRKKPSMVGLICCSSSGRQRQEAPGVLANSVPSQKWLLPQTNFRTCFY